MSFAINTGNLHSISSYKEAEKFYEKTDPLRGHSKEAAGVPLHWDRKSGDVFYMKKAYDPKGRRVYQMYYHYTPCVSFFKNGDIELDASFDSRSTRNFVQHYAPWSILLNTKKSHTIWSIRDNTLCDRQRKKFEKSGAHGVYAEFLIKGDTLLLKRQKSGWCIPETSINKVVTLTVNRKKSKVVHDKFEGFLELAKFYSEVKLPKAVYTESNWGHTLHQLATRWHDYGSVPEEEWVKYIAAQWHTPYQDIRAELFAESNEVYKCFDKKKHAWGVLPSNFDRITF